MIRKINYYLPAGHRFRKTRENQKAVYGEYHIYDLNRDRVLDVFTGHLWDISEHIKWEHQTWGNQ